MGQPSHMRSVVDRNIFMRRIPVSKFYATLHNLPRVNTPETTSIAPWRQWTLNTELKSSTVSDVTAFSNNDSQPQSAYRQVSLSLNSNSFNSYPANVENMVSS